MQQEKIGQVTLDYQFYPGEDRYSDGEIEDEMLEIAKSYRGEELEREIVRRGSWPVLYHFSHVRENIVEWLPMDGTEHVLEIGAGPGAITGVLARKAAQVTCIDLSRRRSLINAYRHRDCGNLRLLVGNFQDIERNLEEKFDLITLIGVFEYAQFSIQSETPFLDYLACIRRHLKPGGRLVIAIENRLGLKYWAGATEDHTGVYFEGLEGYPTTDYVRTFSRPELEALLRGVGLSDYEFYYPYPDYKLPDRIYSDGYLPKKGELTQNQQNFDRERIRLFSEARVYDSMCGSGLFAQLSNSFLVVAREKTEESLQDRACRDGSGTAYGKMTVKDGSITKKDTGGTEAVGQVEPLCKGGTLYTKYSNERRHNFRIRTDIRQDADGTRRICKLAADEEALDYVRKLHEKYLWLRDDLAGTGLTVNECELRGDQACFPFVEGRTLEEKLDGLLARGRIRELAEEITRYFDMFVSARDNAFADLTRGGGQRKEAGSLHWQGDNGSAGVHEFRVTEQFQTVFGSVRFTQPMMCRAVSDIDMIFSNAIECGDGYELIDYEWTFDFPIPAKFIEYRCLYYYIYGSEKRGCLAQKCLTPAGVGGKGRSSFNEAEPGAVGEDRIHRSSFDETEPDTVGENTVLRGEAQNSADGIDLFTYFGISEAEREQFAQMERSFQQYILGAYTPAWKLYDEISDGVIPVMPLVERESTRRRRNKIEVYFDDGRGFGVWNCRKYCPAQEGRASLEIALPEKTTVTRVDPCGERCIVRILELTQDGHSLTWRSNGAVADNGDIIFDTEDPQIIFDTPYGGPVKFSFLTEPLDGLARELVLNQHGKLRWIEQTKVWKAYRKVKRAAGVSSPNCLS